MNQLKVILWNQEIGRLVWNPNTRRTYFMYNPNLSEEIPDIAPLMYPIKRRNMMLPILDNENPKYHGLPPFIADSLPDSWGNVLFDKWIRDNRIPRNKITPLYKLMFIGPRGMGALEYEPYADDLIHTRNIDIKSLYDMSLKILEDRDSTIIDGKEEITLQNLLAVGTSAGGRQMKAIIAINNETGEIRSGQTDNLEGYDYYILKFGNNTIPLAEIETVCYKMAVSAGIIMEDSRKLTIDGVNHFLTKRFDRKEGEKIYSQTLAAINPDARCYEDLIATCRELSISEKEIEQIFMRMVFNVLVNNTDDHNKNFSFLLERGGNWTISPAYDMTFIFNEYGTGPNLERKFSIGGKTTDITKEDLLSFAQCNDIKNANDIINNVAEVIKDFAKYAHEEGLPQPWQGIIKKSLDDNLAMLGFVKREKMSANSFFDKYGRKIDSMILKINSKRYFEVSVLIDGKRHRRFVRPNMELYSRLCDRDIYNLDAATTQEIIDKLFLPSDV